MGEIQKQIKELEEAHEKMAKAVPSSENVILRSRVIHALAIIGDLVEKAKTAFPKITDEKYQIGERPLSLEVLDRSVLSKDREEWFEEWL